MAGRLLLTGWPLDRVWAEDGAVFLADARDHGWRSIGYSYAGYLHGLPRVLAVIGSHLPLSGYARWAVVVSGLVCALVAALVCAAARQVTGSRWWAVVAGLATVSAPALGTESLGSLANLQWFLLYGALWLCLTRPEGTRWPASAALAVTAAATTPLTVVLLPVLLLLHGRRVWRHPAAAGLVGGLVLQVLCILRAPRSTGLELDRGPGLPPGLGRTYVDSVAGVTTLSPRAGAAVGVLVLLAGAAALCTARRHRREAVIVALTGALLFVGTSVLTGATTGRYAGIGTLFLWAALVLAAGAAPRWASALVGALLATSAVIGLPVDAYLLSGPSWSSELDRATSECRGPAAPDTAVLRLSPKGRTSITVSCRALG